MQNDKICSEIVGSLVRTRYEANLLLKEVDLLLRAIYKVGSENFTETIEKNIRAKVAQVLLSVINDGNREEILKLIKTKVETLNYLGIKIAFEPSLVVIDRLSAWVRQNVGDGVILDITIDKSILGGAAIEYKGRIFSDTLSTKVNNYFMTTKNLNN
jgi:F0F1-type ATP synthase delta subunit